MTTDDALRIAEAACEELAGLADSQRDRRDLKEAAAVLARLREELPELIADTRALQMRFGISSSLFDGKVFDQLDAILACLEERGGDEGGGK